MEQYFEVLAYVRPVHEVKLTALVAVRQVALTGKPASTWRYRTRVLNQVPGT